MIPFFVVDKWRHIPYLDQIASEYAVKLGLMASMGTMTPSFEKSFKEYTGTNLIKFCDSGVFGSRTSKSAKKLLEYPALFDKYQSMKAEYGIMLDVLHDKDQTLESARLAKKEYKKKHSFKLVVVAQGKDTEEYIECYSELKKMGFQHIAIGGLLKRQSSRIAKVEKENILRSRLTALRTEFPNDWMFALGIYNHKRHKFLQELNIFGADSKTWIFKYKAENHLGEEKARISKFNQRRTWIRNHIIYQILEFNPMENFFGSENSSYKEL